MQVLMFGWEFPPHITGGLGTACHGLTQSLAKLVHQVTFVMPRLKGDGATRGDGAGGGVPARLVSASDVEIEESAWRFAEDGVEHVLKWVSVDSPLMPYVSPERYAEALEEVSASRSRSAGDADGNGARRYRLPIQGGYGPQLFDEIARYAAVAWHLAQKTPHDVIHAHDWMTFPAGMAAKRATGKPLVVHVHALEFDRCGESVHQGVYDIERQGMEAADLVIAVSRRTRDMIVERYGIDPAKVRVVHNGIEPLRADGTRQEKRLPGPLVVFLGRITMQKGPEYFLEAAYLVKKRLPAARFVMAGTGDLYPKMVRRMAELDLTDCFHFTGFVDETRRHELLAMADCFVMSSVSEPFGLTPVEAAQFGVPVVVSRQSGVAEVLTGSLKVDFWDVRRMADAVLNVLTQDGLARQLAADGRKDLDHIDWDVAARSVVGVYQEVLG